MARQLLKTDPIDLKLTATGDLFVGPNGTEFTSGGTGVAQAVSVRLKLFMEEWFLNLDAGVDWYAILGEKLTSTDFARSEVARVIKGTPGIDQITKLNLSFDDKTRELAITFAATTIFGDSIPSTTVVVPIG